MTAVTAHLLASDERGRILLLRTAADHGRWQLPGGRAEPGESPAAAAEREAGEETGLDLPARDLLVVAWIPGRPGRSDRLALLFSTRTLVAADLAAVRLQECEVDAWRLTAPDAGGGLVHPLLAERIAAVTTHGPGRYLEQSAERGPVAS